MQLYFDYIFWVVPYPHRPSFERDLADHREERPDQEEWIATVYGVVSFALGLPAQLLPLGATEIRPLLNVCFEHMMAFLKRSYDVYSADRSECVTRFEC